MPFQPEKITKEHVLQAAEQISNGGYKPAPSTGYDVIINGKPFPPKEILRIAHLLATGENTGKIYGGEPTNKWLRQLDFDIQAKKDVNYYVAGAMWGNEDQTERFINEGIWENGHEDKFIEVVKKVKVNDRIAIKSSYATRDKRNYLRIKALGTVVENITDGNSLIVEWDAPFDYYDLEGFGGYRSTIQQVFGEDIDEIFFFNQTIEHETQEAKPHIKFPLNRILYGPPGTGKTYKSIDLAVKTVIGISSTHADNKKLFDTLRKEGQIEFVTFHQNYGYEDFMVGIKPDVEFSALRFKPFKGIFYEIAKRAKQNYSDSLKDAVTLSKENWVRNMLEAFKDHVESIIEKEGKYTIKNAVSIYSVEDDAFVYTGEKADGEKWKNERLGMHYEPLIIMLLSDVKERKDIKGMSGIPSLEKQHATYCFEVIQKFREYLKNNQKVFIEDQTQAQELKNFVLIIDEINRANISRVFGELITLIEDDKRLGEDNELTVTLPNSEKEFGVPPNLYIIGTMNTADKSIALVDIALRRRFEFISMYPSEEVLEEKYAHHIELMNAINNEIFEKKNSADFLIGHGYFMKEEPTETILKHKVIPLLMEYFSGKREEVKNIFAKTMWKIDYDLKKYEWTVTPKDITNEQGN